MGAAALVLLALSAIAIAEPASRVPILALEEQRYCGPPPRQADGSIKRRSDVLTAFSKAHPCPVTGLSTGACPGWAIDHVISLACGGCDAVSNLQWLPASIKSCGEPHCKDRFERLIYCEPMRTVPRY